MNDTKKILIAAAAGVAVGAIVGVLFAPGKGRETRKKIIDEGENLAETLKEKFAECKGKSHDVKQSVG
ncbi:MAG: YtxH domain-containing protein [Bacteroidota bacterium]